MSDEGFSVGLLTALVTPELEGAMEVFASQAWTQVDNSPRMKNAEIRTYHQNGLTVHTSTIGEAGQAQAALETMVFLDRCRIVPNIVFLCGIAGSLYRAKYQKTDVVVGSVIYWRCQDKISDSLPCPEYRNKSFAIPNYDRDIRKNLELRLKRLFPSGDDAKRGYKVNFGEIYSGNYVVSSKAAVAKINTECPDACCVEMEGGGFISAVSRFSSSTGATPMLGIVVRGISDYAEGKDVVDDTTSRAAASRNATNVAIALAKDFHKQDLSEIVQLVRSKGFQNTI
jgi:nucleoside phosphorylase